MLLALGILLLGVTGSAFAQAPISVAANLPRKVAASFPLEEQFSRPVAPGIELTTITRHGVNGPLQLFATRVNLRPDNADVRYRLQLATPEYSLLQYATVSNMAKKQTQLSPLTVAISRLAALRWAR